MRILFKQIANFNYRYFSIVIFLCLLLLPILSISQQQYEPFKIKQIESPLIKKDTTKQKKCEIKDVGDVFRELFHKKNKKKKKSKKEKVPRSEKKVSMLVLPNISYNPANGLLVGVGGNVTMYLGSRENTRISAAGFTVAYTTENQVISFIKSYLFTAENKFFFSGDWRYYKYSESTYGLGTNAPDSLDIDPSWGWQGQEVGNGDGYPMKYNYVILHEIANMKVIDNFYLGIGYQLDYYWNIQDKKLNLTDSILTPHWTYSKHHGFDTASYMLSGVSLNVMYDSRDNQISAYKGIYARLNYRMNPTFFGSSENSTELWAEFRAYVGLSKKIPRHLIAFWFFGDFLVSGNQPYYTLMALGNDQKGRSGRGYTQGRFRGQDYMYAEAEYRFPLMRCAQTLGGVIFVNASTASNRDRDVKLFNYVSPGVGFGLRILVNKHTRMNIAIDFGFGLQSRGIYFGGTEVF